MAHDLAISAGSGRTVRARDIGPSGEKLLQYLGAVTAIPTVVGFANAAISTAVAMPQLGTQGVNATHALLTVDAGGGDIRFREDSTNPTAAVGLLVTAGSAVELTNLSAVRLVATTGSVNVNITYRRYDQ